MSFGFLVGFQFFVPSSFKLLLFSLSSSLSSLCTIVALHFSSPSFQSHSLIRSFEVWFPFYRFVLHSEFTGTSISFFLFWNLEFFPFSFFFSFFGSMVNSSEVRRLCPSLSFFFACLGASLGSSCSFGPLIENFVFGGSGLSLALADLLLVLRESVDWFEGIVGERRIMSEVRSSELETRLSSNDDPVEMEEDTATSSPRELRAFSALGEVCGMDAETLSRFRDRFQFPKRVRIRLPHKEERACHFSPREMCFYKIAFQCGLRFPVHPFIMELLGYFNIAPRQLMPNS